MSKPCHLFKNSRRYFGWLTHKTLLGDGENWMENILLGLKTLQLDHWPSARTVNGLCCPGSLGGVSEHCLMTTFTSVKRKARMVLNSEVIRAHTGCTEIPLAAQVKERSLEWDWISWGTSEVVLSSSWSELSGTGVGGWSEGRCRSEVEDRVKEGWPEWLGRHCAPLPMSHTHTLPENAMTGLRNAALKSQSPPGLVLPTTFPQGIDGTKILNSDLMIKAELRGQ